MVTRWAKDVIWCEQQSLVMWKNMKYGIVWNRTANYTTVEDLQMLVRVRSRREPLGL